LSSFSDELSCVPLAHIETRDVGCHKGAPPCCLNGRREDQISDVMITPLFSRASMMEPFLGEGSAREKSDRYWAGKRNDIIPKESMRFPRERNPADNSERVDAVSEREKSGRYRARQSDDRPRINLNACSKCMFWIVPNGRAPNACSGLVCSGLVCSKWTIRMRSECMSRTGVFRTCMFQMGVPNANRHHSHDMDVPNGCSKCDSTPFL